MGVIKKVLFLPLYLLAVIANLITEAIKQMFSFVCGAFFLLMAIFVIITILNHAWEQTILLMVLLLIGYIALFGVVALKIVIEEFKNFCFRNTF